MRILARRCISTLLAIAFLAFPAPVFATNATQDGSVSVGGVVPGPPPASAPTIDSPEQNATFTEKKIEVKGTCLPDLVVRIFRNDIFAGSAACQPDHTYSLQLDLTEDRNDLVGRQYDSLNQSSPDSDTVSVFYAPPTVVPALPGETPPAPTTVARFQLVIDYDYSFEGVTVNRPLHLPIHFVGGTPPYAVHVDWGDGNSDTISRETSEQFFADHTYAKPGQYTIKLTISDSSGTSAFLQFVLVVNGELNVGNALFGNLPITPNQALLYVALPAVGLSAVGLAGGFFFGHRLFGLRGLKKPKVPKA